MDPHNTGISFFFGANRNDEKSETQFVANSRGTCEMLRGGLQDLTSLPTSRRAPKKKASKKSASRSGQSLQVKTRSRGASNSYCAIRLVGRPDQARFQRVQLHQNTLHVRAAISDCTIRLLAGLTKHGFKNAQFNAVKRGS